MQMKNFTQDQLWMANNMKDAKYQDANNQIVKP